MTRTYARSGAALAAVLLLSCGGGSSSPPADPTYTITLRYCSAANTSACDPATEEEFPADYRAVFQAQADRIQQMITAGLVPLNLNGVNCGQAPDAVRLDETVHGLIILASIRDLGGGGILAQSGPCIVRSRSRLPLVSVMRFNSQTIGTYFGNGALGPVVLHEMFHTVGFGTIWQDLGRLRDMTSPDPAFTGARALSAAKTFNEAPPVWVSLPVEPGDMAGTSLSHWRESTFGTELMTGFVQSGTNPLSAMSIASLSDLGYQVDPSLPTAEPYQVPAAPALRALPPAGAASLEGDVILTPPAVVDEP
jgi:hypothetical protein